MEKKHYIKMVDERYVNEEKVQENINNLYEHIDEICYKNYGYSLNVKDYAVMLDTLGRISNIITSKDFYNIAKNHSTAVDWKSLKEDIGYLENLEEIEQTLVEDGVRMMNELYNNGRVRD